MPVIAFLLVVWVLKNAAMDVIHAANGTSNPRYEAKKAAAIRAGRRVPTQSGYLTRDYFRDFWSDLLWEKTELRRRRAVGAQPGRAPVPQRTVPPINLDERPKPAAGPTSTPAPAAAPAPTPVVAPDAVVEPVSQPAATAGPEPEFEPAAVEPSATVLPFRPYVIKNEEPSMSTTTVSSEVYGLTQSLAYANSISRAAADHTAAGNEAYIGHLVSSKVSGICLSSAHDMQEAAGNLEALAARHANELARQIAIQEQYDANPDAGDKSFQTEGR